MSAYWDNILSGIISDAQAWQAKVQASGVNFTLDTAAASQSGIGQALAALKAAAQAATQAAAAAAPIVQQAIASNVTVQAGTTTVTPQSLQLLVQTAQAAGQQATNLASNTSILDPKNVNLQPAFISRAQTATDAANQAATALNAALQAVQTQLQTQGASSTGPGSFNPGTPGGGGGGGGYDDGGDSGNGGGGYADDGGGEDGGGGYYEPGSAAAEELQRFRQSGGEYDPFADEEGGSGSDGEAAVDEQEDTGASNAVQRFRESGGTWDPFTEGAGDGSTDGGEGE